MTKITFLGAGSTVFVRNVIGDCMLREALRDSEVALYDIDAERLTESKAILENMNATINGGRMKLSTYCGLSELRDALRGADFAVNAINVGGYDPATIADFEIPKKYGLRQTIADTLGIGGIFRALRTIPVMLEFARVMEEVCPDAWFLNYTNPMAMVTGAMLKGTKIKTVGLCHSVQVCVSSLLDTLGGYGYSYKDNYNVDESVAEDYGWRSKIAGINHQAWLLEVTKDGKDMYPELREKAAAFLEANYNKPIDVEAGLPNLVRLEMLREFGYYVTESSEHSAEYMPYWIKSAYPELIAKYGIPIDEYIRRCINQRADWKKQYQELKEQKVTHRLSIEYGSLIMNAMKTNQPARIGGNVVNRGLIENLPADAIVEVPCLVDANGIQGTHVGRLPTQCAALNMTNVNVQLLTIEAALTRKKSLVYQAAMLDPHTAAELPIDKIKNMCDELFEAHRQFLPEYSS